MADGNSIQGDSKAVARWIWRGYMRHHLPITFAALLLMALEGSMMGALSYMVGPMFDELFEAKNRAALPWIGGAFFGIFAIRAFAAFGHKVIMARVGERMMAALQHDIVKHMLTLDMAWFHVTPPGNLIERVRGDTTVLSNLWNTLLAIGARDTIATISLFVVAMRADWVWTLIAIAGFPLLVVPVARLHRLVRAKARQVRAAAADISTQLDEIFHGVSTIRLNRIENRETDRLRHVISGYTEASVKATARRAAIPALTDLVAGLGFLGVVTYGGLQIMDGTKSVGEFMSFFTAIAMLIEPLRRIGNVLGVWQTALASLERLHDVFDMQPTITSPARPATLSVPARQADIVLDDVHLSYGDTAILNGLSFTARAGQMTALVGPSGAGKTTVFNLLARLVEPQSGRITLGGTDINQLALTDLRDQFSFVSQEAMLFDETLRDNILLGRTDISDDRLQEVLEAAHIADFLSGLEAGLDSRAGPRGSKLSGGQRQRVAIARALLRDSPILLLDEATSALDAKSERVVQEALERLSKGRTTLVIAHRLATVRDADNIVVMDRGRVAEQGSHSDLLARGGIYAGLYQLQFSNQD
ncbi:ABC transporter ATP-binding protein [Actibacterium sp. XHP0104]|uniref:ABC transporter ATP-binding protein n=1 Tax=Actibacterium sp. XHP0104 TaxID=2984335 RepID=UPI0021E831CD|nr:ABC transporter ATP-binding protein [Actibacterium sp. XHP0104]MCV2882614.1 ABC transporter ATP-binding protein/permease [Actibacterium sp. XHP0104]